MKKRKVLVKVESSYIYELKKKFDSLTDKIVTVTLEIDDTPESYKLLCSDDKIQDWSFIEDEDKRTENNSLYYNVKKTLASKDLKDMQTVLRICQLYQEELETSNTDEILPEKLISNALDKLNNSSFELPKTLPSDLVKDLLLKMAKGKDKFADYLMKSFIRIAKDKNSTSTFEEFCKLVFNVE